MAEDFAHLVPEVRGSEIGSVAQLYSKTSRLEKYCGAVFFAILIFGFAEGWYKSIYETPLGGASFSDIMVEDDDADGHADDNPDSSRPPRPSDNPPDPAPGMKQSEAQFQRTKLSKNFKSNLQMCFWWLGDRCRRCTANLMGKIAYPLLRAHGERLRGRPVRVMCWCL